MDPHSESLLHLGRPVERRARWLTLQDHLTKARALLEHGTPSEALPFVEAALDIDPGFLAAQALRETILERSALEFPVEASFTAQSVAVPPVASGVELWLNPEARLADEVDLHDVPAPASPVTPEARAVPAPVPAAPPAVEARARQKRVDRCISTAREMMSHGRFGEAREMLAEARSLSPVHVSVAVILAELAVLEQRRQARPRRIAAAAGLVLLGVGWLLIARPSPPSPGPPAAQVETRSAPSGEPPPSVPTADVDRLPPVPTTALATTGTLLTGAPSDVAPPSVPPRMAASLASAVGNPEAPAPAPPPPAAPVIPDRRADVEPSASPEPVRLQRPLPSEPPAAPLPVPGPVRAGAEAVPPPGVSAARASDLSGTVAPLASAGPPAAIVVSDPPTDDERLVRAVLQQYRSAYDALDATSAQQVWPSVDARALAKAFGDLSAQQLRFDDCGVQVQGGEAQATCRGSARYVPKVGGREPRVEARVWTFALRKLGPAWHIESARVRLP